MALRPFGVVAPTHDILPTPSGGLLSMHPILSYPIHHLFPHGLAICHFFMSFHVFFHESHDVSICFMMFHHVVPFIILHHYCNDFFHHAPSLFAHNAHHFSLSFTLVLVIFHCRHDFNVHHVSQFSVFIIISMFSHHFHHVSHLSFVSIVSHYFSCFINGHFPRTLFTFHYFHDFHNFS